MEGGDSTAKIEGLDAETLMQLLKEKAKELNKTMKKLKRVEDKFVEMHKT